MRDYPYHHLYAALDSLLSEELRSEAFARSEQGYEVFGPWVLRLISTRVIAGVDHRRVDFSNLHERVEINRIARMRAKERKNV